MVLRLLLAALLALPTTALFSSAPRTPMERAPSPTSYEKAKASVEKATKNFADVETIAARDVLQLRKDGKRVLLVDVRTEEEMKVSMLRGAVSREDFESSKQGEPVRTGGKVQESSGEGEEAWDVVVPYCTVGYRSGEYAKKLIDLGYPSVKNSEGVVLWTHEIGSGLVASPAADTTRTKNGSGNDENVAGNDAGVEVKRVHVYASPWDYASEDFETVKFTSKGWLTSTVKSAFSKVCGRKKP